MGSRDWPAEVGSSPGCEKRGRRVRGGTRRPGRRRGEGRYDAVLTVGWRVGLAAPHHPGERSPDV